MACARDNLLGMGQNVSTSTQDLLFMPSIVLFLCMSYDVHVTLVEWYRTWHSTPDFAIENLCSKIVTDQDLCSKGWRLLF